MTNSCSSGKGCKPPVRGMSKLSNHGVSGTKTIVSSPAGVGGAEDVDGLELADHSADVGRTGAEDGPARDTESFGVIKFPSALTVKLNPEGAETGVRGG